MDTVHKDQELESASVTLVDGLHFAGDIAAFALTSMPRKVWVVWGLALSRIACSPLATN